MVWASDVQFVNSALALCSAEPIEALNDGSPSAVQANSVLDLVKKKNLARHNWKFTRKRQLLQQLADNGDASLFGFKFRFQKPSWLVGAPREVILAKHNCQVRWTEAGDYIYSDDIGLVIEGTDDVPVQKWPVYFAEFISYALAAEFAERIILDPTLAIMHRRKAFGGDNEQSQGGLLQVAREQDGFGEPNKTLRVKSSIVLARNW